MKKCSKCGIDKEEKEFYYHRQRKIYMESCKTCNNNRVTLFYQDLKIKNNLEYQLRQRASEIVRRAKMKNIPYSKKMYQTLKKIYEEQNGLCYYTKIPMQTNGFEINNYYCFVIDRIKPELGYVEGNMVFCCNAINRIKSSFSIEELKWWINQINL
jgi:hypothetical protein